MIAPVNAFKAPDSVQKLFKECGYTGKTWTTYDDSQACIQIARDTGYRGRAKHVELFFFANQVAIRRGQIHLQYCSSQEKQADILTKPLLARVRRQKAHRLPLIALQ